MNEVVNYTILEMQREIYKNSSKGKQNKKIETEKLETNIMDKIDSVAIQIFFDLQKQNHCQLEIA